MIALQMILDAAGRHADRPAIESADGPTTYAELVALAREHARNVDAAVVEVEAERNPRFIARCLGAWLAGRAFLPVDRTDPRHGQRPRIDVSHLAYVIATSGSTGTPKLVMVTPRGLPALLRTQIDAFALGPGARSLWLHSPLFDASISDWATALAAGATLVIPSPNALASPSHLRDELATRAITHVDLPPALLGYLDPPPRSLRVVILGGEPCSVERVRSLARQLRVVIVYGPTEATVCSSLVVVDPDRWERPLIGNPLPGITYRVIGGELYIAGDDVLALGYAGDPAETARRFVHVDNTRMYRTGDRVEPCADGLAFVGRCDRQRKLRGRRIELDEVEAVLRRHAREAAVIVRADRLVAFVSDPVDRDRLAGDLPAWMTPSRFVVGALPRTTTGKLDRAALENIELPTVISYADPIERALAIAWCNVLGVETVARTDRFSQVGGDSLARLMFHAAADIVIDGDPTFGEVVDRARSASHGGASMSVVEAEARGRAIHRATMQREAAHGHEPARRREAAHGHEPARRREAARMDREDRQGREAVARRRRDAVLVTGASGFLGRALVRALRRLNDRPINALVRELSRLDGRASKFTPSELSDTPDKRERLDDRASKFTPSDLSDTPDERGRCLDTSGLEVIRGDVAAPHFGLDRDAWLALRARVALVVHCAATIRLGGTWDEHVAVNVGGTAEVAAFVGDDIAWVHVSTLSVFVNTDRERGRYEAADVPAGMAFGGYAQSKIAAEAIARECGATIVRLGLLVGEGDCGQLPMTIRGIAKLGCVPADARALRFDVTPVEHAAARIVGVAGGVHHVASARGMSCGELVERMRAAGVAVREVDRDEWNARARARVEDADVAMAVAAFSGCRDRELFLATGVDFAVTDEVPAFDVVAEALR